ncbi:MAG: hypothetical protein D6729_01640 [Deltaproteobacteria bacterium]|nr:MAG: hypothetical protein D6729_01640 [Deltaproteobacteria bacterium]
MDLGRKSRRLSRGVRALLALALIELLWLLPSQALPGAAGAAALGGTWGWRGLFARAWISADLLALATWVVLRPTRRVARIAAGLTAFLLLWETYEVVVLRLFHRAPVIYNDLLLAEDALNLALDLGPGVWVASLAGVVLWAAAALLLLPRLYTWIGAAAEPLTPRGKAAGAVLVAIFLLGVHLEHGLHRRDSLAQSTALRLVANLWESVEMARALETPVTAPGTPTNAQAFSHAVLPETPDIYLVVLESYGMVLAEDPGLAPRWHAYLEAWERRLRAAGFLLSSGQSVSPCVGGESWLASTSILEGIRTTSQHRYRQVVATRPYGMPRFFAERGYATVGIQPANRARPGIPLVDPYGWQHPVFFEQLAYHGPSFGWGVVPDEYSLRYAYDQVIRPLPAPRFVYFATVSTHAPWTAIPQITGDWRVLPPAPEVGARADAPFLDRLLYKLRRRLRRPGDFRFDAEAYFAAIRYDLEVLFRFLLERAGEDVVLLIVGDHQPPFLPVTPSHATPVHVLSRRPAFQAAWEQEGFVPGVAAERAVPTAHWALYSLLVRALLAGTDPGALPPRLDGGAALVAR